MASWIGYFTTTRIGRHTVDFRTTEDVFETGGTAPWPPGSAPSATSGTYSTDDYIVTETVFNTRARGREIDPTGDVTKYLYDDASRVIAVIEAYDDAALHSRSTRGRWQFVDLDDDEDRVTSYVYNGIDQVVRMAALPSGSDDDARQSTPTA